MFPVVAFIFVAFAAAEEADFFFNSRQKFSVQADANCSICYEGITNPSVTSTSCSKNNAATITSGTDFTGTCGGTDFSTTCVNGFLSPATPSNSALAVKNATGNSANKVICTSGSSTGAGIDNVCRSSCNNTASACQEALDASDVTDNATASCVPCSSSRQNRGLRQVIANGMVVLDCNCNQAVAADRLACCTTCFTAFCTATGTPLTSCGCNGAAIACPACSSGKDSNKLLLLLLLLLLLIPLFLCCLLLACCCLRRKKKEQDTHFSTFDPQAGPVLPVPMPMCGPVPTSCVAPMLPTSGVCHGASFAGCGPTTFGPATFGAPVCGGSVPML